MLNPGAFHFEGKTWLVLRVAEGVPAGDGTVSALVLDATAPEGCVASTLGPVIPT